MSEQILGLPGITVRARETIKSRSEIQSPAHGNIKLSLVGMPAPGLGLLGPYALERGVDIFGKFGVRRPS